MRAKVVLSLIVFSGSLCAQAPTIRVGIQIVIVDVNVSDSHGDPVHGLKASDFTLTEDSSAQTITNVEEHVAPPPNTPVTFAQAPKLEPGTYTNYTPAPAIDQPLNIVLLDTLNTPFDDQITLRNQLKSFVEGLQPGTRIAIFNLTMRLNLLQGFTSEPGILLAALDKKANPSQASLLAEPLGTQTVWNELEMMGESPDDMKMLLDNMTATQNSNANSHNEMRQSITLDAVKQISRYVASFPGRKNLIWFAGSIPAYLIPNSTSVAETDDDASVRPHSAHMNVNRVDIVQINRMLTQNQIVVYPVDARGLFNPPMFDASISGQKYARDPGMMAVDTAKFDEQKAIDHLSMNQFAQATGGKAFFNSNDLRAAVRGAVEAGANYYTLIYTPANMALDGKFRTFHIKTAQPGLHLAYRQGYYAAASTPIDTSTTAKAGAAMQTAMRRGAPAPTEVLFKAQIIPATTTRDTATPDTSIGPTTKGPFRQYTINYDAEPTNVAMPLGTDGNRELAMQFVTIAYDPDGKVLSSISNTVSATLKPENYTQVSQQGLKFTQTLSVPTKSEVFLRIGVEDLLGNKLGALEVPAGAVPEPATK